MMEQLRNQLTRGIPPRLWVIGDVMLDRYLNGSVERVSPEAPVPVLLLGGTQDRAGGAANVAQNIVALGGQVALGGALGQDEGGNALLRLLSAQEIGVSGMLRRAAGITTVKLRALAGSQQLLRIDQEQPTSLSASEITALLDGLAADLPGPDIVVVSDYSKGLISPELLAHLRSRVAGTPIFVDPKGRDYSRYKGVALITPNEREAALASGIEIRDEDSLRAAATRLSQLLPGTEILITRSARGMSLLRRNGDLHHAPAQARRVFDVTGAGDTALATLAVVRAHKIDWPDALHVANVAAGIAVSKIGAVPVHFTELLSVLAHEQSGIKLIERRGLPELRKTLNMFERRLVFTNGCFDLLHVGHLRLLQEARALGDALIVAVNSDASVRRLKGAKRPVTRQEERAALLAGLEAVDYVTIFEEDTPLQTVLACRPDILVKGGDYTPETIVGRAEVESWGGRVATIPLVEGRSTTKILEHSHGSSADHSAAHR